MHRRFRGVFNLNERFSQAGPGVSTVRNVESQSRVLYRTEEENNSILLVFRLEKTSEIKSTKSQHDAGYVSLL